MQKKHLTKPKSLMRKALNKLEKGGTSSTWLRAFMENPHLKSIQWWWPESIPLKIRNETRIHTPATYSQHCTGNSSQSIKARKGRQLDWKGRSKTTSVHRWHNPKYRIRSTKILFKQINKFKKSCTRPIHKSQ